MADDKRSSLLDPISKKRRFLKINISQLRQTPIRLSFHLESSTRQKHPNPYRVKLLWHPRTEKKAQKENLKIVMSSCLPVLLVALQILVAEGKIEGCQQHKSCGACISRGDTDCAWCEDSGYMWNWQPRKRCDLVTSHKINKCMKISNPKSNDVTHSNKPLDNDVKVSPQNVTLHLRPGQPATVTVSVVTPINFPVDLYYLTDMSASMFKEVKKIKTLGRKIAAEMAKVTTRFRLGFGSFVDKPLAPYVDTYPPVLAHPNPFDPYSVPAFSFNNIHPLNKDATQLESFLSKQNMSGNVDRPEGLMEALLQVAVCAKEIGWQAGKDARRVVVITTDADYHFAGDGLLGGIVIPHDGGCHLENGKYVAATSLDYPSVGLVRDILLEHQVVPIFATSPRVIPTYQKVSAFFGEESYAVVAMLSNDSSNIVRLIGQAYEEIARTMTIHDDIQSKGLTVKYTAHCPDGVHENRKTCSGVKINESVSFDVSVTVAECSDELPDRFSLKTAFGEVNIQLEYICSCECETNKERRVLKSPDCNGHGTLTCGLCHCDKGWIGRLCNCTQETGGSIEQCPRENSTDSVCYNRGKCVCRECQCSDSKKLGEVFYGKACECSNMNCPKDPDTEIVCGGRGACDCGRCKCSGNWTGPSCSCSTDTSECVKNEVLCSGRGVCKCGRCACNSTLPYRGTFCDECPSCKGKCAANKACVQCKVFGTGKLTTEQCAAECEDFKVVVVSKATPEMGERCSFIDDDDCTFVFAYKENENRELVISVQKERACPKEIEALLVILGVILGILAIGLALLLIWKLLATIQDRREFAKCRREAQKTKSVTVENPIFKPITTTFQNPMYGAKI